MRYILFALLCTATQAPISKPAARKRKVQVSHLKNKKKQKHPKLLATLAGTALTAGTIYWLASKSGNTGNALNNNLTQQNQQQARKRRSTSADNQVAFATTNQYQQGGPAACLHIAATAVKYHLTHPKQSLYNPATLNQFCTEGAKTHSGKVADEFNDIFTEEKYKNHYKLKLLQTGQLENVLKGYGTPRPIIDKQGIEADIKDALKRGHYTALLKNGPEACALIIHPDKTFSLFDSHGKQATYNKAHAYIQHYRTLDNLYKFILANNLLREIKNPTKQQLNNGGVYLYWVGLEDTQ